MELKGTLSTTGQLQGSLATLSQDGVESMPISITENGTYNAPYGKAYTPVTVNVEGLVPTGTLSINENGTYDVTIYAEAEVNVKQWDSELADILNGTATELSGLPIGVTKIKPYAFYSRTSRRLPEGYDEIEYVQSTGTQYILANLSFAANTPYTIIIDMQGTVTNDGVGIGWNAGGGVLMRGNKYSNGTTSGTTAIDGSQRVIVTIEIKTNGTSDYIFTDTNGTVLATLPRSNTSLRDWSHINYPLFATTGNVLTPPSLLYYVGKIYRFTAYMSGTIVSDFIPALHNGEVGFYNIINSTFYQNSGTGTLIGGDVVPYEETDTIQTADLDVTEIGNYAFYNNDLSSLTLRANQVVTLGENALAGTPIAYGTGYIYVPSQLVDTYEADTQWSIYTGQIRAIE